MVRQTDEIIHASATHRICCIQQRARCERITHQHKHLLVGVGKVALIPVGNFTVHGHGSRNTQLTQKSHLSARRTIK
jgi:hypothetical protein